MVVPAGLLQPVQRRDEIDVGRRRVRSPFRDGRQIGLQHRSAALPGSRRRYAFATAMRSLTQLVSGQRPSQPALAGSEPAVFLMLEQPVLNDH